MKKSILGLPLVEANEIVEREVVELSGYCHMKFPPLSEATLSCIDLS